MHHVNQDLNISSCYCYVLYKAYKYVLTLKIIEVVAYCKTKFSKERLISLMSQELLVSLLLMHIKKQLVSGFDPEVEIKSIF